MRTKQCYSFINDEEQIECYKKYLKDTYNVTWAPKDKKRNDYNITGVFEFGISHAPDSDADDKAEEDGNVSAVLSFRRRCVAVTNDISVKGKDRWFNGLDVLSDTDGCKNLIDYNFVQFELRLPILADGSPQPDVVSHGVGGSAMFKEYVETTILLYLFAGYQAVPYHHHSKLREGQSMVQEQFV